MGASTVAELISKGKAENAYNNSGIKSDAQWYDFFNDALRDLVDDLCLEDSVDLVYDGTTTTMDLPADYYSIIDLYTGMNTCIRRRRFLKDRSSGYWIQNQGSAWTLDIYGFSAQTFTLVYNRYAAKVTQLSDVPEVPASGEMALVYYAISKALRNSNQVGQAQEMEARYKEARKEIRTAVARGRG
jgi:hypothetical protein